MNKYKKIIFSLILSLGLFIGGCENDNPASSWPPPFNDWKPRPVIQSFAPADTVYAGMGEILITGQNFSSTLNQNHVSFFGTPALNVSSTETELRIITPALTDMITPYLDSVMIKMRVDSAKDFAWTANDSSEEYYMTLKSAALEYGGFDDSYEIATGITCDINENVYVNDGATVYAIDPDSGKSEFTSISPITGIKSMKIGPQGYIYFSQSQYILRIEPNGTFTTSYLIYCPSDINDIDFDQNDNLFAADKLGNIYRIDIDAKTVTTVASYDSINFKSLRVYDNFVYVAGTYFGSDSNDVQVAIWRNEIQPDFSLGQNELYIRWDDYEYAEGSVINSITFSSTGDMYIGPNEGNGMFVFKNGTLQKFYDDILFAPINTISWGNGEYLYIIGSNTGDGDYGSRSLRVVKIYMGSERSAPYYGRQ